jgi:hypothetical protein
VKWWVAVCDLLLWHRTMVAFNRCTGKTAVLPQLHHQPVRHALLDTHVQTPHCGPSMVSSSGLLLLCFGLSGRTCAPPMGWCTMMRALGRQARSPGSPAASSSDAMLAAWPTHSVLMGQRTYCSSSAAHQAG